MAEETKKAGEFRSALMGFKKGDVLAYIDALTAENLKKEAEHLARLQELQGKVGTLEEDKNTLLAKTREICDQLTEQQKRTETAQAEAQELRQALQSTSEKLENSKMRMFSQEKDLIGLRNENRTLQEQLAEKVQQIEQMQKTCDDLRKELAEKAQQLQQSQADAQQKAEQAAQAAAMPKIVCDAPNTPTVAPAAASVLETPAVPAAPVVPVSCDVAAGVEILKQQIHDATDSLHTVLDEARSDLKKMNDKLDQVNSRRWCGAAKAQKAQPRRSLADILLERVSRILAETHA